MRFLIIFNIALFFIFPNVAAQKGKSAEINWGKELREPNGTFLTAIVPFGTSTFYGLRQKAETSLGSKKEKVYIEHYNEQMNLVKSNEVALKYKKNNLVYEDFLRLGNELYLFSSYNNEAKKKNYLFAQKVNRKTLSLSDNLINIGEIDTKSVQKKGFFGHHISRDSSKILIFNALPYQKGMPERFALHVYDNQFNELWTKDISLPYNDKQFSVEEYQVDNKGNVYLLGLNYKPDYFFTILVYTNDGNDFEEFPLKAEEKLITDLTFLVDDYGDLVCSGFYSELNLNKVVGTYFFRLDTETKTVLNKSLKEFDTDFMVADLSARQAEKAKKSGKVGLQSFSLDKLILRSDGGALLIAEQYFVEEFQQSNYAPSYAYSNSYSYTTEYYYYYNDIIIVNIQPDGSIEWVARIPKQQVSRNDGGFYSSYAVSIVRDKIYFIYNDTEDNYVQNERINQTREFTGGSKRSLIAVAEISRDGSVDIFPLFKNRDADIITRPKMCKQAGKKEMIIYGEKNKTFRFGKVEFL